MQTPPASFYEFGAYQLDAARRLLRRRDGTPVPLTPRVFDTLLYMVEHPDGVLDKERIMEAVWSDSIVEENNLAQAIWKLRQVFGEKPGSHDYIATVPGRGYRFVAAVTTRSSADPAPSLGDVGVPTAVSPPTREDGPVEEAIQKPPPDALDETKPSGFRSSGEAGVEHPLPTKTIWRWVAGVAAIAILALAALFFLQDRVARPSAPAGKALSLQNVLEQIPDKSIAVLPFENRSHEADNAFFADGVQDEILTDLARIADLKVISRTSVMQYKSDVKRNLRQIAKELGVAHILEGSVQRAANRVRVNAQLIDARTDAHLWAQTYDRDLADVFAIQSDIAKAIADQLQAKLSPGEKSAIEQPPTTDVIAFDLYSRAKTLMLSTTFSAAVRPMLQEAVDLLNQATVRDPSFFLAYCQLAYAHDHLYFLGHDHTPARLAMADAAIQAAFRLRPDAGEAHLARAGNLYRGYFDYDGALAELEIARRTLPNDPRVFELTGYIARRRGQHEEGLRYLQRAIELDPRNFFTLQQLALSYLVLRRYSEEAAILDRALSIKPDDVDTKIARAGVAFGSSGDTRPWHQAVAEIRAKDPAADKTVAPSWVVYALAERDISSAERALDALGDSSFGTGVVLYRNFGEGLVARLAGDEAKAGAAFVAARREQEGRVEAQPNYAPALCLLGWIDAALGRKEEALREGRRAMELLPVEKDSINGMAMIECFAVIAAWVGEKDLACEQLAKAVQLRGGYVSYGGLKLLPFWDPLRGDPRFEKIVASLAPKEE